MNFVHLVLLQVNKNSNWNSNNILPYRGDAFCQHDGIKFFLLWDVITPEVVMTVSRKAVRGHPSSKFQKVNFSFILQ